MLADCQSQKPYSLQKIQRTRRLRQAGFTLERTHIQLNRYRLQEYHLDQRQNIFFFSSFLSAPHAWNSSIKADICGTFHNVLCKPSFFGHFFWHFKCDLFLLVVLTRRHTNVVIVWWTYCNVDHRIVVSANISPHPCLPSPWPSPRLTTYRRTHESIISYRRGY